MLDNFERWQQNTSNYHHPKANKTHLPEQMQRKLIEKFNNQQPHMANKVVKLHIMRN